MSDFEGILASRRQQASDLFQGLLDTPLGPGSRNRLGDIPGMLGRTARGPVRDIGPFVSDPIEIFDVIQDAREKPGAQLLTVPGTSAVEQPNLLDFQLGGGANIPRRVDETEEQRRLALAAIPGPAFAGGGIIAGPKAKGANLLSVPDPSGPPPTAPGMFKVGDRLIQRDSQRFGIATPLVTSEFDPAQFLVDTGSKEVALGELARWKRQLDGEEFIGMTLPKRTALKRQIEGWEQQINEFDLSSMRPAFKHEVISRDAPDLSVVGGMLQ